MRAKKKKKCTRGWLARHASKSLDVLSYRHILTSRVNCCSHQVLHSCGRRCGMSAWRPAFLVDTGSCFWYDPPDNRCIRLSLQPPFSTKPRRGRCTHDPLWMKHKSTIARVMTKFNTFPRHTWVPDRDRIFPLTVPTSLQSAAEQNWTGRVNIPGEGRGRKRGDVVCLLCSHSVGHIEARRTTNWAFC